MVEVFAVWQDAEGFTCLMKSDIGSQRSDV